MLFCCSATGEKLKPLVIGIIKHPAILKKENINCKPTIALPLLICHEKYHFTHCQCIESLMKKISNVTIGYLPSNLTLEFQPLNQGIIKLALASERRCYNKL